MAGLQANGIGSGIDINGLVSQLVAAERAPQEQRLNRAQTRVDTQISAVGQLRSTLATLQAALAPMRGEGEFRGRAVRVSDDSALGASAASSAAAGRYAVEVRALASAQRLASAAYAGGPSSAVGTGTLTVSVAGSSFDVAIASPGATLSGIRDAINAAPDNSGVQATLIQAVDGTRLVLTSTKPGALGAIRVTQSGGDGGLAALVHDPGSGSTLAELAPARDADVRIEGFAVASPSNSVTGAIDGITLNLLKAQPGTIVQVEVAADQSQAITKLRKLVSDYNSAVGTMAQLRRFDPATRESGPLLGDALLRGLESTLRVELARPTASVAPGFESLAAIGIRTGADGKLTIDEARLNKALAADFDAVGRMLGGTQGLAARLYSAIDASLQTGGQLSARSTDLQNNKRDIERERNALAERLVAVERRYRTQFVAMDRLLSELQSTGNYLAQQLANLPKPAGSSR